MNGTLGIAIAVVLPIAAFILLVVLRARKQRFKKKAALVQLLDRAVREDGLVIAREEWLSGKVMALDAGQHILLYARHDDAPVLQVIHLDDVRECRLKYTGSTIREQRKNGVQITEEHVRQVSLAFTFRDHSETELPVYSEIRDGLHEKLPLIGTGERWLELIRRHMAQTSVHSPREMHPIL